MATVAAPPPGPLDPAALAMFQSISSNPSEVISGQFRGYLEDFIRITVGTTKNGFVPPTGFSTVILKDLTAQTAEYVYIDADGVEWLYGNGAAVSQATYADLYAFFGANAWGADSGGNFLLPDGRGRGLFMCGTNAATDLGDSDGVAEASRQAKHAPTASLTVTGAPGVGSLALSNDTLGPKASLNAAAGSGTVGLDSGAAVSSSHFGGSGSITGAPSLGTLAVGGTVGSGMSSDGPAHLYIGSLLVRF